MDEKFCPLRKKAGDNYHPYYPCNIYCAWYDKHLESCGVMVIAEALRNIDFNGLEVQIPK